MSAVSDEPLGATQEYYTAKQAWAILQRRYVFINLINKRPVLNNLLYEKF